MSETASIRALRLMDMVPFLVANPGVTVARVAEEFSISRDQVLKDLNLLFLCGLPGYSPLELIDISFDDDVINVRDPQNLDRPRRLTEGETLTIRIALRAFEDSLPDSNPLKGELQALSRKLSETFSSTIPESALALSGGHIQRTLALLNEAISNDRKVAFTYHNRLRNERKRRVVSIDRLNFETGRTFLEGYCETAQGRRTFDVDQIENLELLSERGIDSENIRVDGDEVRIRITDDAPSRQLPELRAEDGNGGVFSIPIYQQEWMVRRAFIDPGLQVLSPTSLREEIRQRAQQTLALYSVIR